MFLLLAIAFGTMFVAAIGTVVLISVGHAAALGDDPSMDLALARK